MSNENTDMYYIVESNKNFDQVVKDLDEAIKNNGFGILHIHNLGSTLRSKGVAFKEECKIFEVCNPLEAAKVLSADMRLNMALPCRISVYTEHTSTKIGFIRPEKILSALSHNKILEDTAKEVEEEIIQMLEEAKA